ncbi:selT selW selH seleno domain-containing protein [Rutstroemia sp. NJR-2017a BVV2]|nr:selT selW selH seleno domain-containing protein [Rutstroemia sp. NJR-2017a BVV2]
MVHSPVLSLSSFVVFSPRFPYHCFLLLDLLSLVFFIPTYIHLFFPCRAYSNSTHPPFAQELLSTFSTDIGEVALQPSTGGTFVVTLYHAGKNDDNEGVKDENGEVKIQTHVIWDRKVEGGFPGMFCFISLASFSKEDVSLPGLGITEEHVNRSGSIPGSASQTKELKKRVRNIIDPTRDLGHVDGKKYFSSPPSQPATQTQEPKEVLNARGKIVIEGEEGGFGYCRPGDEDCGGF